MWGFKNLAKGLSSGAKGLWRGYFPPPWGLLRGECLAKKGISIQTGHLGPVDDIVEGCDIACTDSLHGYCSTRTKNQQSLLDSLQVVAACTLRLIWSRLRHAAVWACL